MPAEDRIGCKECANQLQLLESQHLAFHRQPATLIVAKQDSFFAKLLFENVVLSLPRGYQPLASLIRSRPTEVGFK